jgi:hypothetical protein
MGIFADSSKDTDITKTDKEFYRVFTDLGVIDLPFDNLEQAQKEAEIQAKNYPGMYITIWAFKHHSTVQVPIGDPLSWHAGSEIDEAIKARKESGKKLLNHPLDPPIEETHG